ncbi:Bacteriophage head to tail connecting protein [Brevundimonas sp. SH203]|uniref:portal protein n=1 Tax=Brevundimonas sp. SH203 TaxID=345167 RepID=UPI0009D2AA11|nr:portal protein [Brevundimonas sp. SH203]GAW42428.1 Bacteriophage head to tail connecting protein [Brevundimonas sp. SH203]
MAGWSVSKILAREQAALRKRSEVKHYIDRAMQFAMPWRVEHGRGRTAFEQLFDSSGPTGVHRFGSRLQRDLTPPFSRWTKLEGGPLIPEDQVEAVNRRLELATTVVHAALDASGFAKASHEAYSDLSIGTGALLAQEGDDNELIRWNAVPPWALAIEEGASGRVDNVYWRRKYPADQLAVLWPKATAWPERVRKLIAEGKTEEVEIVQASYFDLSIGRWRFDVICVEGGKDASAKILETENRTNPWIVFRWWTTPGNPWGLGPLMLTLPDIMTANKVVEMVLKAAAYALAPPLMVAHDGVVNPDTLRVAPHALIRVARTGGPLGSSIQPLAMNGSVDLAQLSLSDMRQNIAQNLMARQLPPESASVRSPTEIVERMREFAFDTGSAFGRMNHEYIPAVISRVLDVLDKKKVPGIDFDELRIDHLILKVRVTSPLAQQQNLEDVERGTRFMELVKAIGGDELLTATVNVEDIAKFAPLMGAPAWLPRAKEDRDKLLNAVGDAAAEGQAPPMIQTQGAPPEMPNLAA